MSLFWSYQNGKFISVAAHDSAIVLIWILMSVPRRGLLIVEQPPPPWLIPNPVAFLCKVQQIHYTEIVLSCTEVNLEGDHKTTSHNNRKSCPTALHSTGDPHWPPEKLISQWFCGFHLLRQLSKMTKNVPVNNSINEKTMGQPLNMLSYSHCLYVCPISSAQTSRRGSMVSSGQSVHRESVSRCPGWSHAIIPCGQLNWSRSWYLSSNTR